MSERLRANWVGVLLVCLVIAVHLVTPGLHAMGSDFWAGFFGGMTLGAVIAFIADRVVLVPLVDVFERRRDGV